MRNDRTRMKVHLPPKPPIEWTPELLGKFDQALLAIGRPDSIATFKAAFLLQDRTCLSPRPESLHLLDRACG